MRATEAQVSAPLKVSIFFLKRPLVSMKVKMGKIVTWRDKTTL